MDFTTKREIEGLKGDIKQAEDTLSKENERYARELRTGLLDEIRNEIANPSKGDVKTGIKNRLRHIKDTLSIMFFS